MNRMDEFKALQQELSETPPELNDTIPHAKQRAKRRTRIRHMIGMPLSSLAACFMVFVLLVNFCTPFASACSNIPALKALAEAVTFNPSLQRALEHDYHQDIGISKTIGDITVSVDTVIVDQKQLNLFYRISSKTYTEFEYISNIRASDGTPLKNSFHSNGTYSKSGEIQTDILDFPGEETMPQQVQFSLKVDRAGTKGPNLERQWESLNLEEYTFVFDLSLDEASIQRGERYEINKWVTLDQQRIYIDRAEIYPTHIRIYLQDDEQNTAWLQGLTFCIRDEHGRKTEQISDGVVANGSDTPFMPILRNNSSFFWESEHLTLEITDAAWLEKDRQYTEFDLVTGKALGPIPDDIEVGPIYRNGAQVEMNFIAPQGELHDEVTSSIYQICSTTYYAPDGTQCSINSGERGFSSIELPNGDYQELPENMFFEHITLENYPYDTVRIGWISTNKTTLDTPIEITLK